jgi:hypothetical protein
MFVKFGRSNSDSSALWSSGSSTVRGGSFFKRGLPRRRWPAILITEIEQLSGNVKIINA